MIIIPPQYKLAAELALGVAALVAAGACGALVMHWRDAAVIADDRATFAKAQRDALGQAVKARDAALAQVATMQAQLAAVDAAQSEDLRRFKRENDSLRADAERGAVRLRVVGAHCPAAHDVPQAAAGSGVDSGAGPELDADARRRYFALRDALGTVQRQLAACQTDLGTLTGQRQPAAVAPGAAFNAP